MVVMFLPVLMKGNAVRNLQKGMRCEPSHARYRPLRLDRQLKGQSHGRRTETHPTWMKVDAMIVLVGLIIVTVGIWVANARLFGTHH